MPKTLIADLLSRNLFRYEDTETKMDNGAALVVGGGGRVSHLVIPEPAIDYPSFLCLSARPVKSAGVTQTNRSVFQSVLSREYLSASIVRRPCLGIEDQPLALFSKSSWPCQEGNRPRDPHQPQKLIGSVEAGNQRCAACC